ncbi:aspartate/glutamate racemase family protein [Oceanisphaera pacifica]|uniref:Amino acid racemase n=1 Tax=Oceanisphaera pacifica TaxID=2818389 RepID=A0ABS3ND00_9GAMM|nr:amino acid racemase [Oceanisphaera pacifica]MBO1518252.1 amino acid racemase [Oceanisphaera pacifica]
MRKLGLVGGTGPEATVLYYQGLIAGIGQLKGSEVLPKLSIESLSPFEVFAYCEAQDLAGLTEYLLTAIHHLAAAGAECAALTAGTTHIVFDELVKRSPIELISMLDATRNAAQDSKVNTVGLLGTAFTMNHDFFARSFAEVGIKVVTPNTDNIALIQQIIASELEHGVVTDASQQQLLRIINDMVIEQKIEQVILGCTELPLILNNSISPVSCLDPVPLHIKKLVTHIAC